MSQEKAAEIIDINAPRSAPAIAAEETKNETSSAETDGAMAGAVIAAARRGAGLTLSAVSADTKIRTEHLEAIEASDPSRLPSTPFAVGFVKTYAGYLNLDVATLAAQFRNDIGANAPTATAAPEQRVPAGAPSYASDGVRFVSLLGVAAIFAFALWITWQIAAPKGGDDGARNRPGPSVTLSAAPAGAVETVALEAPVVTTATQPVQTAPALDAEPAPVEAAAVEPPADIASVALETTAPEAVFVDNNTPPSSLEPSLSELSPAAENPPAESLTVAAPEIVEPVETTPSTEVVTQAIVPQNEPPRRFQPLQPPSQEDVIEAAVLRRSASPRYPKKCESAAAPIESVTLVFDVTATGRIANARVASSTNSCFNAAAVATTRRWRFNPRTVNNQPRPDTGIRATLKFER